MASFDGGYNQGFGRRGRQGNYGGRKPMLSQSRKRRNNYDQLQQFEQRDNRWGGQSTSWDYEDSNEGWYDDGYNRNHDGYEGYGDNYQSNHRGSQGNRGYGNDHYGEYDDDYDDGRYHGSYYDQDDGGYQWSDRNDYYGYDESNYSRHKRGRFRNEGRGRGHFNRDPHSFSFYDDHDDSYGQRQHRRNREEYGGGDYRSGRRGERDRRYRRSEQSSRSFRSHSEFSRNRDDSNRRYGGYRSSSRKRSSAEDAIYEKHKLVTVEKEKRTRISDTMYSILSALRLVAQQLYTKKEKEKSIPQSDESVVETEKVDVKATEEIASDEVEKAESVVKENVESEDTNKVIQETGDDAKDATEEDKAVSDDIETKCQSPVTSKPTKPSAPLATLAKLNQKRSDPVLLGAIKCGECAMRILIGEDLQGMVVVLSKKKPTRTLLEDVQTFLEKNLKEDKKMKDEIFTLTIDEEKEYIVMRQESITGFKVVIRLTSPEWSSDVQQNEEESTCNENLLSATNCRRGLVMLRRMRFFTKKLDPNPVLLTAMRVLLDFRSQSNWSKLPVWTVLVLINAAVTSGKEQQDQDKNSKNEMDFGRVDVIFKRCLEILSSGILLPGSVGIKDPCESDVDASEGIAAQDAEDITNAAQKVLRLIAFDKLRSILDLPEKK